MVHATVDAVLRLVERHRLRPAEVREIVVRISRKGTMLGNPHPASPESA